MSYWIADDDSTLDFEPSGAGWRKATRKEYDAAKRRYAVTRLAAILKPGSSVYPIMTHRSSSGMSRRYRVFLPLVVEGSAPIIRDVTRQVADACGFSVRNYEIVIGGCGFSGSFQIVYDLGHALWPNGTPEPHGTRNGVPDSDGGYALQDGRL